MSSAPPSFGGGGGHGHAHGDDSDEDDEDSGADRGENWYAGGERRCVSGSGRRSRKVLMRIHSAASRYRTLTGRVLLLEEIWSGTS